MNDHISSAPCGQQSQKNNNNQYIYIYINIYIYIYMLNIVPQKMICSHMNLNYQTGVILQIRSLSRTYAKIKICRFKVEINIDLSIHRYKESLT